jgi:transcriptional regulator with XRE-family HTH domain
MAYDPLKIFAENIRRRRLALTWSQERLAHEAKLDRTYIGAVEREERNITLRSAQRIALALGSNLWELLMPHG